MIVRADMGRGLAHQTHSFYTHLQPDVTVCVDMSLVDTRDNWPQDFSLYPDAIVSQWRGFTAPFEHPAALNALASCDVVYTAETYYDERLPKRVNTVLHVNPEFFRSQAATRYWYPTTWRTDHLPPGEIVPTPIPDDDIALTPPGEGRFLHVGGHRAAGDRSGSVIIGSILGVVTHPWRITSQDGMRLNPRVMAYTETKGRTEDRWELYDGCGVLVYPRRYGGQSLVVNEAMTRGLAVVMGDNSPNPDTWPIYPVPSREGGWVRTPAGRVRMGMIQTTPLKQALTELTAPELLGEYQAKSLAWARDNSWSSQRDRILKLLADAC